MVSSSVQHGCLPYVRQVYVSKVLGFMTYFSHKLQYNLLYDSEKLFQIESDNWLTIECQMIVDRFSFSYWKLYVALSILAYLGRNVCLFI